MATPTVEMPPPNTSGEPNQRPVTAPPVQELHLLISELRDENSRSRMREAAWISVILHLILVFGLREMPRFLPKRPIALTTPEDLIRQRELTYLEQPPDSQKVTVKPKTDKISDKDRIATSKNPQIDKRALEQLARAGRTGAPGANPQQPMPPPQLAQQQNPLAGMPQQPPPAVKPPDQSNTTAKLEPPLISRRSVFGKGGGVSAGAAIEQAARASAQVRGGGIGGEYGAGPGRQNTSVRSDLEILSDTMGVDFGPYMQRVLASVRSEWYNLIPEVARPPILKQGRVAVEFVIMKDGSVKGMRLAGPSGDVSLDRAAWGGITASNPFPPLPSEFTGEYLALRFHFLYNPDRAELR